MLSTFIITLFSIYNIPMNLIQKYENNEMMHSCNKSLIISDMGKAFINSYADKGRYTYYFFIFYVCLIFYELHINDICLEKSYGNRSDKPWILQFLFITQKYGFHHLLRHYGHEIMESWIMNHSLLWLSALYTWKNV